MGENSLSRAIEFVARILPFTYPSTTAIAKGHMKNVL